MEPSTEEKAGKEKARLTLGLSRQEQRGMGLWIRQRSYCPI